MHNVTIIDVAPRDGLQNEPESLPVETRIELVERLVRTGVPRIEIGSFVNPKQVLQMAGTAEVAKTLLHRSQEPGARPALSEVEGSQEPGAGGPSTFPLNPFPKSADSPPPPPFTALVPNLRGYERAVEAGLRHVRLVLAASESLNQANFRRSVAESLADFAGIAARARSDGVAFGVAIGASFGCPFEGHVPPERVLSIAGQLVDLGASEIVLADTTGMAVPSQVYDLCARMIAQLHPETEDTETGRHETTSPGFPVSVSPALPVVTAHFHNTRNTGYANAYAALQAGITHFDASLGGIGGCPFAPRAVGNIATEDLVHMLHGMGVATGIDLVALIETSDWLAAQMGKTLPALVGKAGPVYRWTGGTYGLSRRC